MSLLFGLDPKYNRQVFENLLQNLNMLTFQLSRVWVDESARLAVRVGYMDDGYIRIRDAGDTSYSMAQMTQELLRGLQYGFGVLERPLTLLSNALASVGTNKLRITPVDPFPQSPITIAADNVGLAKDSTLSSRLPRVLYDSVGNELSDYVKKLASLDVALTVLARLLRWGRDVTPVWIHGSEVTAPAAGTALVSKTVSSGKSGYIYGFFISAGEANDFKINWTSGATAYSRRIIFGGKGSLHYVDFLSFNEGLPANAGTTVSITNVNAGSSGVVYQAAILYAEV